MEVKQKNLRGIKYLKGFMRECFTHESTNSNFEDNNHKSYILNLTSPYSLFSEFTGFAVAALID